MKFLISLISLFVFSLSSFAQFEAGDNIRVSETFPDDIYMAGGEITIDAPVHGDAVLAGGNVNLNDSVLHDLTIAGGEINVRGFVGDDIRVAGGSVEISSDVMDDLIIFSGNTRVNPDAVIHGNVVSYGGELIIDGIILGNMKASGGKIAVNGIVEGDAQIASGDLEIGENAAFLSNVAYWTEGGSIDFGDAVRNGEAQFDSALAWEGSHSPDAFTIMGYGMLFMTIFLFGGYLILLILDWTFRSGFNKAAHLVITGWSKTLGVGVVYVVGLPILVILSFSIVIGIPIGLFALTLYVFSLIFGNFVAALLVVHMWKEKNNKEWSTYFTAFVAMLIALCLHVVTSIPFVGILASFVVLCVTYGALILAIRYKGEVGGNQPVAA